MSKMSFVKRMHTLSTKSLIFLFISFLAVGLTFSSYYISNVAFAAPKYTRGPMSCKSTAEGVNDQVTCCQTETDNTGLEITWCTQCVNGTLGPTNCGPRYNPIEAAPPSPTTPVAPENALPQGDVKQPTPTPPPTGGKGLFGSEVLSTPPTGLAPATPSPSPLATPPLTTGLKGPQGALLGPGGVSPPTATLGGEGEEDTQSRKISPTGYCVPGSQGPEGCTPCDPGLPGANCVPDRIFPGGEAGQGVISPTGGCIPYIRNDCVPCDPGLPGGDCMPSSDWPPPATTDEGTSLTTPLPTVPPGKPLIELTPEGGGTQPQTQPDESEDGGEEPEDDQPEQPEEEPSNEGQGTAGPLLALWCTISDINYDKPMGNELAQNILEI